MFVTVVWQLKGKISIIQHMKIFKRFKRNDHFSYRNFRKSSQPKVVDCSKFSIMKDRESIIQYIGFLQQL